MSSDPATRGRPRTAAIDGSVLEAALAELAAKGYAAFSLTAVAEAAGTTRPALYRRWKGKNELVVDAVARLAEVDPPPTGGSPFENLVTELAHFRHCITEAAALPLAGMMLGEDVDPVVRQAYTERVVAPRRARLRAILTAAVAAGEIEADADLEVAGTFLTGSWFAFTVSGNPAPEDWAPRVARLVWRACGGRPPEADPVRRA